MKVAVVGATGETGTSVLEGLLKSTDPQYEITALVRPSSMQKPEVLFIEERGVKIVSADLAGPEDDLAAVLQGNEVVIACVNPAGMLAQIPLASACKLAGVGRFVPCFFATIAPPKGILYLRDIKEDVLSHVKQIKLPFTAIDVGWWYQLSLPRLASGRNAYAHSGAQDRLVGDGNMPSALTDLRDVGGYVARIIADPRTLNRLVFSYTELLTQNEVYDLFERLSGENIERNYISIEDVTAGVKEAEASSPAPNTPAAYKLSQFQYWNTWGIRGDNTPQYAEYLGYLNAKDLYPDMRGTSLEDYAKEVLNGQAKVIYERLRAARSQS